MKVGVIGLGKMGSAIAQRLIDGGYEVVGFDPDPAAQLAARQLTVEIVNHVKKMPRNNVREIFLAIPAGKGIDKVLKKLLPWLQKGDIIVDVGDSNFIDSQKRAEMLAGHDVYYLDCGLSGGLQGRGLGFSMTVGGDEGAYRKLEAVWVAIAAPGAVAYVGHSGAGHYVKMIHNGIEYALLESYAEGLQLLHKGQFSQRLDLAQIAGVWNQGATIRSWVLELLTRILERDQEFKHISGVIESGQTVKWALENAKGLNIELPVIKEALKIRKQSRKNGGSYATKLIALLRHEFGGHIIKKVDAE